MTAVVPNTKTKTFAKTNDKREIDKIDKLPTNRGIKRLESNGLLLYFLFY